MTNDRIERFVQKHFDVNYRVVCTEHYNDGSILISIERLTDRYRYATFGLAPADRQLKDLLLDWFIKLRKRQTCSVQEFSQIPPTNTSPGFQHSS